MQTRLLNTPKWLVRLAVAVCAAGLALILVMYGLTERVTTVESAPPRLVPQTDVNPYGANFFLDQEVEAWKREKTAQMAEAAGIGWAKQSFPWEAIELKQKGRFIEADGRSTWQKYDDIVDLLNKHHIQVIARLDRPPSWSRQDNQLPQRPPDNLDDYGDFVYAFVNHFKGRIRYIQIWNEPNIFPEWGNQPVDPEAYTAMLKTAYTRAKEADPNIVVLSAPLAMTVDNSPTRRNMSDLDYLERMYRAGAKDYFDILSANAFGMDEPPSAPPDPSKLNFQRVLLQRQIMEKYGDSNKPVWFNEYGWNASPADFAKDDLIWKRVDEAQQAQYALDGIKLARENWPWAGVFNLWYFRQVGNKSPQQSDYYFRMVDVDFTPRQLYTQLKEAAAGLRLARAGYYQETSTPVVSSPGWQIVLAPAASGGSYIDSERPGASATFQFEGESVELVAYRGPEAGRCLVTVDERGVPGLPVDSQGRNYVELYQRTSQWQAREPLADHLGRGTHTLKLTVSEGSTPGASGPRCNVDALVVGGPSPSVPLGLTALLALGLLGSGALLVYQRRHSPLDEPRRRR
ncbi:MAG: hypothetical protein U0641_19645 [Anaerolineae bacterium]